MSVIAWDGKSIASDRQITYGGAKVSITKLWRLDDGSFMALTGNYDKALMVKNWYLQGADPERYPAFQSQPEWATLVIAKKSGIVCYEQYPIPFAVEGPYMAWGSGQDFALAAMEAGASAYRAVEVACKLNVYCGMGIDYFDIELPKAVTARKVP